ncbi:MAG: RNA 2',3'-cyclic phosphodiesterase [Cohaesibacter sp.]|nr:RNA 2',3'-cyclic phosphodiesterase [Cohaesibacter sp.]
MPRLFAGIEIPPSITTRLSLQKGGLHGARWIDEANYHITLHFMGDVDRPMANEIAFHLSQIRYPEFDLTLKGFGSFGSKKPHSIYAAVEKNPNLLELQSEVLRRMAALGLRSDKRDFTPHVTIARLKKTQAIDVADYLQRNDGFMTEAFTVHRFVLYSSRDSIGGGPYAIEDSFDLL